MRVRKLDTENKRDVSQFVQFPFELYRLCSQWVPPLISGVKADLNRRRHPFYRHSTADFFLAESEGQVLGRIAVMQNRKYNDYHRSQVAFFGFFEVVEDLEVARALFGAACGWTRGRALDRIPGPKGLIGSDGGGVLVQGFEYRPAMGTAYNLPYYDALITDSGFEKDRDFVSAYAGRGTTLPGRVVQAVDRVRARRGFWVKSFSSKRELKEWVPRAVNAHGEAFSQNYTYYPPTAEEVAWIVGTILAVADPRLVKLIMKGDEVAGLALGLPNVTAGLQKAKGRLWPLGWLHILRERNRTKWVDLPAVGLLPAYQGLGANTLLYTELSKTLVSSGFGHIEFVLIDEQNFRSLRETKALDVTWHKTHRSYQRALPGPLGRVR